MLIDYKTQVVVEDAPPATGWHWYHLVQTLPLEITPTLKLEPGKESLVHRDFFLSEDHLDTDMEVKPRVSASGLVITTNLGTLFVDDETTCTADPSLGKTFLVSVLRVLSDNTVELLFREKTTGVYSAIPAGRILDTFQNGQPMHIKEFTLVANGTDLVEVL